MKEHLKGFWHWLVQQRMGLSLPLREPHDDATDRIIAEQELKQVEESIRFLRRKLTVRDRG